MPAQTAKIGGILGASCGIPFTADRATITMELNITQSSEITAECADPGRRKVARIAAVWLLLILLPWDAFGQFIPAQEFGGSAFAKFFFVSEKNISRFTLAGAGSGREGDPVRELCNKVGAAYKRLAWDPRPCSRVKWQANYKSPGGNALIYAEFGTGTNTSLYLGGVHPDELTPIHLIFKFAEYLAQNPQLYEKSNVRIIVAPLVNPDAFFLADPPRVNANGVDLNRNFLTLDWYEEALQAWKTRRNSDARYFPGFFPNSEIETIFQAALVEKYQPGKIISVHAPLGFLDYDGPGDQKPHKLTGAEQKAKELIRKIAEKSSNYKIVDYSFYPGSLGNFAGNERGIPTITLELETGNHERAEEYWERFRDGLVLSAQLPYLTARQAVRDHRTGQNSTSSPQATKLAEAKNH